MDWTDFLGRPLQGGTFDDPGAAHAGKAVLVTGSGGYLGSKLADALAETGARRLVLLERTEQNMEGLVRNLSTHVSLASLVPVLGDVADPSLLDEVFGAYRPNIIYHAAAFKHLPLLESHPWAAVRNNALATFALAQAAVRHGAEKLILISTDKAASPTSIMGASKRIAERVALALSSTSTLMTAVRLGNVLGSPGSVVPIFTEQIARGGPVTVTSPASARYFMTRGESVKYILRAAAHQGGSCVLVPDMGPPMKIGDLARFLMRRQSREVPVVFTGLRPGEKLVEQLQSSNESVRPCDDCGMGAIENHVLPAADMHSLMAKLEETVRRRDAESLLRELSVLVPEYRPSDLVLGLMAEKGKASTAQ